MLKNKDSELDRLADENEQLKKDVSNLLRQQNECEETKDGMSNKKWLHQKDHQQDENSVFQYKELVSQLQQRLSDLQSRTNAVITTLQTKEQVL